MRHASQEKDEELEDLGTGERRLHRVSEEFVVNVSNAVAGGLPASAGGSVLHLEDPILLHQLGRASNVHFLSDAEGVPPCSYLRAFANGESTNVCERQ